MLLQPSAIATASYDGGLAAGLLWAITLAGLAAAAAPSCRVARVTWAVLIACLAANGTAALLELRPMSVALHLVAIWAAWTAADGLRERP